MTLLQNPPNTIWLAGNATEDGNIAAAAAITPGMLIELFTVSGASVVSRWRPSTLTGQASNTFAMQQVMLNKGVDDVYAIGDLVQAGIAAPGCIIWGLIPSGAVVLKGAPLSDNGNGMFKAASGVTNARAYETVDNTTGGKAINGAARMRVEFL
jgi:hypothetical protein